MPGLIDSDDGLSFGVGLQSQAVIGTATLIVTPVTPPEDEGG